MAGTRFLIPVLVSLAAIFGVPPAFGQEKDQPVRPVRPEPPRRYFPRTGPEGDAMRDRVFRELQKLTPEQRDELWRAVWAVLNMPADKRQAVLGFDEERRNKARQEIESAIGESGAQLDEARKKAFIHRYFEERKAIEERLRKESDEKRSELVRQMRERLRTEFGPATAPAIRTTNEPK